ncbi:hypothetical protein K449DRAFT_419598 [Hypoxylon sp. EC38]|nr:hypothetical protein K449DRAFT_419598 [Hypoxylon sp. EC38]
MAENLLNMSPISDEPEFVPAHLKKQQGEIDRIIQDNTLDESAKIDAIAETRYWFRGDTTVIDAFLADEIDAATAAETLAKPIDAAYSSADYGRALYSAELTARAQRVFHSPEKALELWGPEEDIPEPGPENDLPKCEHQLWDLWSGFIHASKRIPWTDTARQTKLLTLIQALKARPEPPFPERASIPLLHNWIWESRTLWSDLNLIGPSSREAWSDCGDCNGGWTEPEQSAYRNFNAFLARMLATGTMESDTFGAWSLRSALEFAPESGRPRPRPRVQVRSQVQIAAIWVLIAGEQLWALRLEDDEIVPPDTQVDLEAREEKLPWSIRRDGIIWCTARWRFWRGRFEQEAGNEELDEETREMAKKAGEIIGGFLESL